MFRGVPWDEMGLPPQSNTTNNDQEALGLVTLGFTDIYGTNDRLTPARSYVSPTTLPTNLTTSWPDTFSQPVFPRFIPQSVSPTTFPLRGHSSNDRWWQTANQSYEMIFSIGAYGAQAADMLSADTFFKAIRNGWSSLPVRDQRNPVFMILREMDEKVFSQKDPVSRVALAIKSHRLMKYYLNANHANLVDLASWQRPRPSQRAYKHPIAIDFFAWPGLRDRMVNNHAQYFQTTDFSEAYREHFQFSWPFSFEDTYAYDEKRDTYRLSPLFEKYHRDLKSWRFEEGFFRKYPELLEAVEYVEADPPADLVATTEAPVITRARNSTSMMAVSEEFSDATSAMGQGVARTMMQAQAEGSYGGQRRSVHEPISSTSRRNMSLVEQVGVEGLGDLWMPT